MAASEHYCVSRSELLAWLNGLLDLNYTKVEQCASGAAHCQIMDSLFPGKVPMSKVNFAAKQEYEFVNNYKVLQGVFSRCNIDKPIEVAKLCKAKYQDNLEFLQWMKGFHDRTSGGGEYKARERREKAKGGTKASGSRGASRQAASAAPPASSSSAAAAGPDMDGRAPLQSKRTNAGARRGGVAARGGSGKQTSSSSSAALRAAQEQVKGLTDENMELKLAVDGLERERDFYFGKLRDIEIMCQAPDLQLPTEDFVAQVTKILYATEDDFVSPDELEKENEQTAEEPAVDVSGGDPIETY